MSDMGCTESLKYSWFVQVHVILLACIYDYESISNQFFLAWDLCIFWFLVTVRSLLEFFLLVSSERGCATVGTYILELN